MSPTLDKSHSESADGTDGAVDLHRERLPETRRSVVHKFTINGTEGYLIVGLYDDDRPGEVFIKVAKEGSTLGGLMNGIGVLTSLGLQYGVSLEVMVNKLAGSRFEPSGHTKNPDMPVATSILDYVFRYLSLKFPEGAQAPVVQAHDEQAAAR